ncbi:MAG: PAS domain S-box protein [Anaerolineales bacterium]|nr:PAS domain S-box protein [Anaerolineales bacterium]
MAVRKAKALVVASTQPDLETHFQSNEIFKNAFQYSAIGMALVSLEGKWLKVNPKVCEIVGYAEGELLNLTFQDITHPDDLDLDLNYVRQMIAGEIETYQMEKRYFHKNKNIVWVLLSVSLARDSEKKPLFFISQIEDITEQKLARQALEQSEFLYRDLVENTQALICTHDLKGNLLSVNDAAVKLTGYTRKALLKMNLRDALTPKSKRNFDLYLASIKQHGKANGEMYVIIANGETRVWEYNNTLRSDGLNEPIVRGMARDVTEQKQASEALQASEKRYRNFFDNSPIPLWEEDLSEAKKQIDELKRQGVSDFRAYFASHPDVVAGFASTIRILDVNQAALKLYGAKNKEELFASSESRSAGEIENNPEDFIAIAEGKTSNSWDGADETLSGEPIEISLNWSVVPGHEHDYSKVIVTTLDITERKRAKEELQKSEERYKNIVEDMPTMMCRFLADGTLTFINEFYCQYFNKSYEELLGSNLFDLIPAEEQEAVKQKYLSLNQEKPFVTYEYKTVDNDGKVNWQKWTDRALFNEKGEILEYQSIGEDISEQKIAEEKLRKSEEYYRRLTENFPNGSVNIYNRDLRLLFTAGGDLLKHNATSEDYVGKTFQEISPPETFAIAEPHLHAAFEGKSGTYETTYWGDNYYSVNVAPLYDADGNINEILVVAQNITGQKQASEIREESEKRYRSLFEDSPISLWEEDFSEVKKKLDELKQAGVKDFEAYFSSHPQVVIECASLIKILNVNKASVELYNAKSKEDLTTNMLRLLRADNVTKQFVEELIQIANGKTHFEREEIDSSLSGEPLVVSIVWSVMPGHEEDLSRVIVSIVDITERKQAEEERRILIDELGERVKELTFLHNISRVFMDDTRSEFEILQAVADAMPAAWQYPEVTAARVGYNGYQFTSPNFRETDWMLSEFFELPNGLLGVAQVAYLEEKPPSDEGPFLSEERQVLSATAEKLKTYIKGILADQAIQRQLNELETLYESGLAISQLLTPKGIAQKVIDVLERRMNWHHIAIREYHPESNSFKLIGFNKLGISPQEIQAYIDKANSMITIPSQGLSGWVTIHGQSILSGNVKADERYLDVFPDINSGIYVPLKVGEKIIGSIAVESEEESAFSEHDKRLLETLAGQAAIAIENANLFNELEKRVQERTLQIEATKRRLELATHAGQIGVWEYKPRENTVVWDERMHIIYHVSSGEFDGTAEAWAKYIHPEDLAKSQIHSQLAFTENLLLNNEHRIIWPDGSIRYISTSAVTVFTEDNMPDRIIGICRDITERKQIEQSLQESESYARLLFDAAPDPVFVMESDGTMVDVNQFFEMQHQINRESLQGKNISALNIFPHEELQKANEYLTEIMSGKSIPPVELKFYAPDDELHTLELHSYPIEVQGRMLVLSTSRDITTHKKFEEALKLANAEMENALKVKDEFLANMSHELRTPLNAILGISESLEEQMIGTLNEKQQKYVGIIKESGKHLLDLINDILDISKIEAGRMELTFQPIAVEKLCQSSLRMIKELAQKKKIQVSFKVKDEVTTIMGDERRLKQVLVNLLSNAVKFTEEGNKIGLEVTGYPERNEVTFSVWDTGIGIAEEDLKFLFKPFVQLDAGLAREFQGTGLGLALVAQMVRLHGGSVSVKSKVGKGSMFTITLPWEAEEQNTPAKVTGELVLPSQKSETKRKGTILLVEDTDIIVSLVKDYLTYKGYEVIVAYNGREGIYFAKEKRPDLILMDVMMPIMNGIDATLEIRKDQNLKRIPIIALTALAMPGDRERCLEAGMTDYMSKPVKLNELIEIIEKYTTQG